MFHQKSGHSVTGLARIEFVTTPICTVCGNQYQPKHVRKDAKYCSTKCKDRGAGKRRRSQEYRNSRGPCSIEGCVKPARWTGAPCAMHYRRLRLTGDAGSAEQVYGGRLGVAPCEVDGCTRKYYANGLCSMHYNRKRQTGNVGEAELRRKPVGSGNVYRYVDKNGYVYLTFPDEKQRKILEHRYIMEKHLGRPLWPDENVHHRNGNRSDNRFSNLELWSTWQPKGQRVDDKITYARELLARYCPDEFPTKEASDG